MLKSQQELLKLSELRERINTHPADGDTEKLGEYTTEAIDVERRYRAAVVVEAEAEARAESSGENAELRSLTEKASLGGLFEGVVEHREADSEMRELQQAHGLASNAFPVEMLIEERAVTPAPGNVEGNQAAPIPYVFADSVSAFLSIPQPTVGVGDQIYPVLTKELDVRTPAENAAAVETTGAFSAELLSPSRLQASFFYSIEDGARFRGMDSALRQNLREGLQDGLDDVILSGTNGLLEGTNLPDNDVSTQTTYALYRSQFNHGRVDGRYASRSSDIRIVFGSATFAHAASQYRGNNDNMDALMSLTTAVAGVRVSAHVPAVSGNKQNGIVRLGSRMDAVSPIWRGVSIVPDSVTKLDSGQVKITAIMLYAFSVLRSAGFHKQQTQHA